MQVTSILEIRFFLRHVTTTALAGVWCGAVVCGRVRPGVRVWSLARLSRCFEVWFVRFVCLSRVSGSPGVFLPVAAPVLWGVVLNSRSTVTTACQGGLLCKKQGKN